MAPRRTTTQRGYGWRHQQDRARLLQRHRDGTRCWWCGEPMNREQALAADHTRALAHGGKKADRLLHLRCNSERGDGSRDHLRPALLRASGGHAGNVLPWGASPPPAP